MCSSSSDPNQTRTLIIAGMGRSGTSMSTHWVQRLDLDVGKDFQKIKVGNIDGAFEDAEFRAWHIDLLTTNGFDSWLDVGRSEITVGQQLADRGRALAVERSRQLNQWAFKDPIASLVLGYWLETLPNPQVLFLYRPVQLVVDSIGRLVHRTQRVRRNRVAGAINRLRWRVGEFPDQASVEKWVDAWILYNKYAVDALERLDPAKYWVVRSDRFPNQSGEIHRWIRHSFEVSETDPIDQVFKPSEMNQQASLDLWDYRAADIEDLVRRLKALERT